MCASTTYFRVCGAVCLSSPPRPSHLASILGLADFRASLPLSLSLSPAVSPSQHLCKADFGFGCSVGPAVFPHCRAAFAGLVPPFQLARGEGNRYLIYLVTSAKKILFSVCFGVGCLFQRSCMDPWKPDPNPPVLEQSLSRPKGLKEAIILASV